MPTPILRMFQLQEFRQIEIVGCEKREGFNRRVSISVLIYKSIGFLYCCFTEIEGMCGWD